MYKFRIAIILALAHLLIISSVSAQAPQKMSYQAVIRNASNALITSAPVGMRISILQGSSIGTAVYVETQTPSTNANGLVSLEIGTGSIVSGTFANINWATGPYFIKTETDPTGGTSYTISGTNELMSVPYALFSASGANGTIVGQMNYWNGTSWILLNPGAQAQILTICGGLPVWTTGGVCPTGSVFCASGATAIVDVTSPTGRIWMDRNLGATQAATSSTDENSYGDLYQWGRRTDGHQCRTSPTTTTLSAIDQPAHGDFIANNPGGFDWRSPQNDNLWQGVNGVNNPCPIGYRLPTETELDAETGSWNPPSTAAGAFASPLKLPLPGSRLTGSGSLSLAGTHGFYWTSTVSGGNSRGLGFNDFAYIFSESRAYGFSVRCLKD